MPTTTMPRLRNADSSPTATEDWLAPRRCMVRMLAFAVSLLVFALLIAPVPSGAAGPQGSGTVTFTEDARRAAIQQARVWAPTNVSTMDLRLGPQDKGSFLPNAMVECDYVEAR